MQTALAVRASLLAVAIPAGFGGATPLVAQQRPDRAIVVASATPSGPWSLRVRERVRGTTIDGTRFDGTVISQTAADFAVGRPEPLLFRWIPAREAPTRVRYDALARLDARRPPRWRPLALGAGLVAGITTGAILGASSIGSSCSGRDGGLGPCWSRSEGALMGALVAAPLGAGVGILASRSRWITLHVNPDARSGRHSGRR